MSYGTTKKQGSYAVFKCRNCLINGLPLFFHLGQRVSVLLSEEHYSRKTALMMSIVIMFTVGLELPPMHPFPYRPLCSITLTPALFGFREAVDRNHTLGSLLSPSHLRAHRLSPSCSVLVSVLGKWPLQSFVLPPLGSLSGALLELSVN